MNTQLFPIPISLGPVTHVRLAPNPLAAEHCDRITDLLVNGVPYTVAQMLFAMSQGVTFYLFDLFGQRVDLEPVRTVFGAYVRSRPDYTTRDNLLSLPRF